jgi:hypothetical protein
LFQEADDDVRRRADGVENIARVDHKVHVPLQDPIHRPSISLLNIHLPLIAAGVRVQLRVPGIPKMRIRNVSYANYVVRFLSIFDYRLF